VTTNDLDANLTEALGPDQVIIAARCSPDDLHDEALGARPATPLCVVRPRTTTEVQAIVAACAASSTPIVARGAGTGLSGGAVPIEGCVLVAFDAMDSIVEIDTSNHVAVVEPGVTLAQLSEALRGTGLRYPIQPGELSGSLGGNVSTNAGGMRAVHDGVTRHHVLGLELVLADASTLRCGGKVTKSSTGYDLTQLIIGSQGTLALVTEVTLKLSPHPEHHATLLAPFDSLDAVTAAVPRLIETGREPAILEYLDLLTMASITAAADLELGLPAHITDRALAYLVVVVEDNDEERLATDIEVMGSVLEALGSPEVFVLPPSAGVRLIEARERAFYVAKASGATDIIDLVVPRAAIAPYLATVAEIAQARNAFIAGCGHAGDGNVHLSVFETDDAARHELLDELFAAGLALGGQISGEHGIGTEKLRAYERFTDPGRLALEARLKAAFDPDHLFNPHLSPRRRTTT
jgi:glycolate oxidase